jgi:uncharacterized protein (UPF0332 family)
LERRLRRKSPGLPLRGARPPDAHISPLAAYNAAQAFILANTGKIARTHSGVRSELARLTKADPAFDRGLTSFLARAYNLKVVADYAIGPDAVVGASEETEAVESAARFVESIARALSHP